MTQKQKEKSRQRGSSEIESSLSSSKYTTKTKPTSSSDGFTTRLYNAIKGEAVLEDTIVATVLGLIAIFLSGIIIPTSIIPILVGSLVVGFGLSKLNSNVFSVLTGLGLAGFIATIMFVNAPFGLGLITVSLMTIFSGVLGAFGHEVGRP